MDGGNSSDDIPMLVVSWNGSRYEFSHVALVQMTYIML